MKKMNFEEFRNEMIRFNKENAFAVKGTQKKLIGKIVFKASNWPDNMPYMNSNGGNEMTREQIEDMAQQLLNISFDVYEWDETFLNEAVKEVANQIEALKIIKEARGIFDTTMDLFDLLEEAYKANYFETEL